MILFPRTKTNRLLRARLRFVAALILLGGVTWGGYCGWRLLEFDSYCVRWREWMQWPDKAMREHGLTTEVMGRALAECERERSAWFAFGLHAVWAIALGAVGLFVVPRPTSPYDAPPAPSKG